MRLNIFSVIFVERKIYDYIIQNLTIFQVYLVMLMPGIYLIPIKLVHKRGMFLLIMAQQSPDAPQSKLLLLHHLIISEILALHEASRECVWLRSVIFHIQNTCGFSLSTRMPTPIFEDNAAYIAQVRGGYIKGDRTKHISPKFFYTHELQQSR